MATIGDIVDRACLMTGMMNDDTEQTLLIAFANEIYREAVERSECAQNDVTVAFAADDNTASVSTETIVRVNTATISDYPGYQLLRLRPVSDEFMATQMEGGYGSTGIPRLYTISRDADSATVTVWPVPDKAFTLNLQTVGVPDDAALVTGDEPDMIPFRYHHRVITNGVVAMAYDREGKHDRADVFWNRFNTGLIELTDWANRLRGDRMSDHYSRSIPIGDEDQSRDLSW